MEFRKNDILTLDIEDCGVDGEGIGKADGFTVFVKDAVIGDRIKAKIIKAKKNYGYGRLMEVITPSPYRVKPACSIARQCGGCQLQALSYEQQLKFKEKKVRGHLERIGGFQNLDMEPIMGMEDPYHYRNKAQFPVGKNKEVSGNCAEMPESPDRDAAKDHKESLAINAKCEADVFVSMSALKVKRTERQ